MEPGIMKPDEDLPPMCFYGRTPPGGNFGSAEFQLEMFAKKRASPWKDVMAKAERLLSEKDCLIKRYGGRVSLIDIAKTLVQDEASKGRKFLRVDFDSSSFPEMRKKTELDKGRAVELLRMAINNVRKKSKESRSKVSPTKPAPVSGGAPSPVQTTTDVASEGTPSGLAASPDTTYNNGQDLLVGGDSSGAATASPGAALHDPSDPYHHAEFDDGRRALSIDDDSSGKATATSTSPVTVVNFPPWTYKDASSGHDEVVDDDGTRRLVTFRTWRPHDGDSDMSVDEHSIGFGAADNGKTWD